MVKAAAIQMTSGPDTAANLARAGELLARAAEQGAALAVLPECFARFGLPERERIAAAEAPGRGPVQAFLAGRARELGLWIVGGTLPLRTAGPRSRAACLVYDPQGRLAGRYDKLHLFDVDAGDGQSYRESAHTEPGDEPLLLDTPCGRTGVAVCYDMRFPELFRLMSARGADCFAVPSAFTAVTGRAHWDLLVRGRAVDNLAFVIAACQWGRHASGRETWGHAMIVDPWGEVLARLPAGEGVIVAELDRERQQTVRRRFPVLEHRRNFPTR